MNQTSRLLPGVPAVESPLFPLELEHCNFTDKEREQALSLYHDGYAVIDFPDAEIDARIERIKMRLAPLFEDRGASPEGVVYNAGRIQDAWVNDPDVRAIAANAAVLELLGKLYQRPAFPFQTLNFKVGTQQSLHTDAVHFSSIPPRFMCGVWLAMEDIAAEAGPLNYVPGSHRWPIIDNSMLGRVGYGSSLTSAQVPYQKVWNGMIEAESATVEAFLARKGQALIWCANLLHGGGPQTDQARSRWSQVTHYFFDDCIYYTPAFSDEYLGHLHLRDLVSVSDGRPRPNLYLGQEILPHPKARPSKRGLLRWLPKFLT